MPEGSGQTDAPSDLGAFGIEDILRIEADGLAVRRQPFVHMPLAMGCTDAAQASEVRLNAGDYVSVDLGPLRLGDTTWYRVWPAEDARLHYSSLWWDTDNICPGDIEPGWIATEQGENQYVSLYADTARDPWLEGLPLMVSGTGNYDSDAFEGFDLYLLEWAYAIDDQLAPCDFAVSMTTTDASDSVVVVSTSTIGAYEEDQTRVGTGTRTPVVGADLEPLQLHVQSGCEWTLRLDAQPHD